MKAIDSISICDCELLALSFGKFTIFINILVGIISLFKYERFLGLYIILTSLTIIIWEMPILYSCMRSMDSLRAFLLEKCFLKVYSVRGVVYALVAIPCYLNQSICIIAGIMLSTNALLLFVAALTHQPSDHDQLIPDEETNFVEENPGFGFLSNKPKDLASALGVASGNTSTSSKKARFGTF